MALCKKNCSTTGRLVIAIKGCHELKGRNVIDVFQSATVTQLHIESHGHVPNISHSHCFTSNGRIQNLTKC